MAATTCYVLLRCCLLLYYIWYIYMLLLIGRVGVVRVGERGVFILLW